MKQASYLILGGLPWLVNWAPSSSTTNWNQLPQRWGENDPCNWNSKWGFVENIFFILSPSACPWSRNPSTKWFQVALVTPGGKAQSIQISKTIQQSLFAQTLQLFHREQIASSLRKDWIYPPSFCTWPSPVSSVKIEHCWSSFCNLDTYSTMQVRQIQGKAS